MSSGTRTKGAAGSTARPCRCRRGEAVGDGTAFAEDNAGGGEFTAAVARGWKPCSFVTDTGMKLGLEFAVSRSGRNGMGNISSQFPVLS